ncbi:hypothetical protein JQS43_02460 [Natronosporangium hydrolyticum]|uniref:Uncharacterized protein n=1 Tax=Natronosporangium hydrolyticum TaxID=2811111 RepID=A0A895YBU5_9ACTN|nr:hypothetical protein [Natronosporangium hydrolyticum]QSB15247.1 hypothetical protein JQS43_02460 [Natronosporangium hydrolyticum]
MTQQGWSGTRATPLPDPARSRSITLLGREPSAWIATIGAVLVAWILILTTRPIAPGLATGVATAGAALLASYRLVLSDAAVVAVAGAPLSIFALLNRQQVEPQETAVSHH